MGTISLVGRSSAAHSEEDGSCVGLGFTMRPWFSVVGGPDGHPPGASAVKTDQNQVVWRSDDFLNAELGETYDLLQLVEVGIRTG